MLIPEDCPEELKEDLGVFVTLNKKIRLDGDRERQNFSLFNRIMKETANIINCVVII